jgi:DNA (cytosine-5)-methyltransferase 1
LQPVSLPATRPIAIDLFSGAGGLAEGLESSGIRVAAAVELHPQPALTHAMNHPSTHVLAGEIQELELDVLADRVLALAQSKAVDVVVGGPPCQGFSTAGRKQADDPRNDLFRHFVDVVSHFKPRVFLLENVPGFKTMHGGRAFTTAKQMFEGLGYRTTDALLQASDFGVPQRRLRFVMVGVHPDEVATDFRWPDPSHTADANSSLFDALLEPAPTVEAALGDIAFLEPGWEAHRHAEEATSGYASERRRGDTTLFNHLASRHREKAVRIFKAIPEGTTISSAPAARKLTGKVTMARMNRHRISNAVLALPDDMIHYAHDRIPTVREMARLQSFDDDYVFMGKRTSGFVERKVDVPQYTQVGNAVPPLLARALGIAINRTLGLEPVDIRNLAERRLRHRWVRGSSGYAGYTLDAEAMGALHLTDMSGRMLELPVSEDDPRVVDAEHLIEWKRQSPARRGQWAPGVVMPERRRRRPSRSTEERPAA